MFKVCQYIDNSISFSFARCRDVRRKADKVEDFFKEKCPDHYGQPQVIPVPDDLDPQVPRLVFGSKHGFSQILVSQVAINLNVFYSPDWQGDIDKGKQYLNDRWPLIAALPEIIGVEHIYFCGINTRARLPSSSGDVEILKKLQSFLQLKASEKNLHELSFKQSAVKDDCYYSNITIRNFRDWGGIPISDSIPALSEKKAIERGVEVIGDFNDRYAYNERDNYSSNLEASIRIIGDGIDEIEGVVKRLREIDHE